MGDLGLAIAAWFYVITNVVPTIVGIFLVVWLVFRWNRL